MKQTITELFIEVEETIEVKSTMQKKQSNTESADIDKKVIEICPHCHQAIFETKKIEIEGDFS